MMYIILSIVATLCLTTTPGQSMSYPVFGTKRYHRSSKGLHPLSQVFPSNPYYDNGGSNSAVGGLQQPYYVDEAQPNYDFTSPNHYKGDYYHPRHEYRSYGMPTFRGEYNPSPYYYAQGPSYSYYDDREIPANPLDDLHEEMLQEDERERQREMLPLAAAASEQPDWYQNPTVGRGQQDVLTNNFLRNLISYNHELAEQQEAQKQELIQREQAAAPEPEYDYYSDMNPNDYNEYDQSADGLYDLQKNENQPITPPRTKFNENFQDEESQLKSLAHKNRQENSSPESSNYVKNQDQQYNNNWQAQQQSQQAYAQYDADPEYGDDSWINWDRKRSSSDFSQSIKAFNDRKPKLPVHEKSSKKVTTLKKDKTPVITATTTSKPNATPKFSGQKEIAVPRPAAPTQRIYLKNSIIDVLSNANTPTNSAENEGEIKRTSSTGSENAEKAPSIYDTIKQLMVMEHQLDEKNFSTESKLTKRFVTSEENLATQLDNLKRRSL